MLEWFIVLLLCGIVAGTVGSLAGLGGGVIIIPVLLYIGGVVDDMHITAQIAVGTSLVVVAVSALASSISYYKQNKIDVRSALLFFAASGPGAVIGAYVNTQLSGDAFMIGFGMFMVFVSFLLIAREKLRVRPMQWSVNRTYTDADGLTHSYGYTLRVALPASLAVGILSGMFGVGGGALMMPLMLILFRFPLQLASATSMFMILLSAIAGSITHGYYGNINWLFAVLLAPGAWLGGMLGAWLSLKLPTRVIAVVLRLLLLMTGIRFIWNGL